jgi:hypothetical protein
LQYLTRRRRETSSRFGTLSRCCRCHRVNHVYQLIAYLGACIRLIGTLGCLINLVCHTCLLCSMHCLAPVKPLQHSRGINKVHPGYASFTLVSLLRHSRTHSLWQQRAPRRKMLLLYLLLWCAVMITLSFLSLTHSLSELFYRRFRSCN